MAEAVRSPLCPDDFCPATLPAEPPSSLALDALRKPGTELWLIRTPADFSPASFNGCKVPLVGFQTLKSHRNEAGIRQRYHVLSNTSRASPETLLAPSSSAAGQLVPAPALQGTLSIIEIPRSKSSGQCLHAIPTSPPPQIPPGLRPRFQAFGGRQPVPLAPTVAGEVGDVKHPQKRKKSELVSQNPSPQKVLNGVGRLNSASGQGMPEPTEQGQIKIEEAVAAPSPGRKKRKKKKKELEGEMPELAGEMLEPTEQGQIKIEETVATSFSAKKKKKKELEGEVPELAGEMLEPTEQGQIRVEEAVAAPSPVKKKKKKKKELEGESLESAGETSEPTEQGQIKVEEAVVTPFSAKKKKKKKKKKELEGEVPELEGRAMELQQEAVLSPTKTKKSKKRRGLEGEVQIDLQEDKSGKRQEVGGEMLVPEQAAELEEEEEEMVTPLPAKRKKGQPGGERVEEAEMAEALENAEPSHTKKKRRKKPEGGEGVAPGPLKESLAGVSESESPSPSQGLEEMKKQRHQEKVGPAEA